MYTFSVISTLGFGILSRTIQNIISSTPISCYFLAPFHLTL